MQHNKLVRDNIPEIIRANGDTATTHIANDAEYHERLRNKLEEEVHEFLESEEVAELADILEVVYALSEFLGTTIETLESIRTDKVTSRGAFKKRIVLDETN